MLQICCDEETPQRVFSIAVTMTTVDFVDMYVILFDIQQRVML